MQYWEGISKVTPFTDLLNYFGCKVKLCAHKCLEFFFVLELKSNNTFFQCSFLLQSQECVQLWLAELNKKIDGLDESGAGDVSQMVFVVVAVACFSFNYQ